jgi:hypothetical protein
VGVGGGGAGGSGKMSQYIPPTQKDANSPIDVSVCMAAM